MVHFSRLILWAAYCLFADGLSRHRMSGSAPNQIIHGPKHIKGSYRLNVNTKICETTEGINTYSGYIDVGNNQSMFLWFFEARQNSKTAPLVLWSNGGPGCSSLVGVLQENGPCRINEKGSSSVPNPYSWNNYANMLYIDQPIGTGFSYGTRTAKNSDQAAHQVWDFLQIFFTIPEFLKYKQNQFRFWSESYGGQYVPRFVKHFRTQNELIGSGKIQGHPINVTSVGIIDAWFDPYHQYESYYDYAQAKNNNLRDFIDPRTLAKVHDALYSKDGCLDQFKQCSEKGIDACVQADSFCDKNVAEVAFGDRNPYYVANQAGNAYPLTNSYMNYLARTEIMEAIGAETNFVHCSDPVYDDFLKEGDGVISALPGLSTMLDQNIPIVMWGGSMDMICNPIGIKRALTAMTSKYSEEFQNSHWTPIKFEGKVSGKYKKAGILTFVVIDGAGHEVPAYKPAFASELFKNTLLD